MARTKNSQQKTKNKDIQLPEDIFRQLIQICADTSQIFALKNLSEKCHDLVLQEIGRISKKDPIRVDIHKFFLEENPFLHKFVGQETELVKQGKLYHQDVRKLCDMLEGLLKISENFAIENLQCSSLGWIAEHDDVVLKRTPFMLQKRIVQILKRFNGTSLAYSTPLLRPSRFIRTFSHRYETIRELDLGNIRTLAVLKLRSEVFPALVNLEKLTWHKANSSVLKKLVNKKKISKLELTEHPTGRPTFANFMHLAEFENLEELYFGLTVPNPPTRMVMDILLNLYQSIWKKKVPVSNKTIIQHFEKLKNIGFWNAPENFFIDLAKRGASIETVNFGKVSQDLKKLCSFDSVMQSLFKFEESEVAQESLNIQNLNLNLHSMPVVSLEYYLPNLMDRINKKFDKLKSVSIFLKCLFSSEMPANASWSLETKKEKMRKFVVHDSTYTDFSLTCIGTCGLLDLDRQLPSTLRSFSVFLHPNLENSHRIVQSVVKFIEKLGDMNNFPDLEEFHIQIWGVRCLETLVDAITDNLGSFLKKLSIFALPRDEDKSVNKNLIGKIARNCPKLENVAFSPCFLELLVKGVGEDKLKKKSWRDHVRETCQKAGMDVSKCQVDVGKLPKDGSYYAKPEAEVYPEEDIDDLLEDEYDNLKDKSRSYTNNDEYESEEDKDSMFMSGDDEVEMEDKSMDELDMLEQKLEKESKKRHQKWEKKKKLIVVSESEDEEVEDDEDIVDFDKIDEEDEEDGDKENMKNGRRNKMKAFFDDEAVEANSDSEESDLGDEEEAEEAEEDYYEQVVENNIDSNDERLINEGENGRKDRKRRRSEEVRNSRLKRKKIIVVSDDEDEDDRLC